MKYKVILKTSNKHSDRVSNCVNTWLGSLDYVCLTDKLTGNYPEFSGSLDDGYESNEEKTVNFINVVRSTSQYDEYDWLVFIDDDAILNVSMFESIIETLDKSKVYGHNMIGCYSGDRTLAYPSGGCGYFISPSVIKGTSSMTNKGYRYEDVCMGKWLEENNISIDSSLKLNGWFPFQSHYTKLWEQGSKYVPTLIASLSDKDRDFLTNHLTHHYIRHVAFMEYINDLMRNKKAS